MFGRSTVVEAISTVLTEQLGWEAGEAQSALCRSYAQWLGFMEMVLNKRRRQVNMLYPWPIEIPTAAVS